MEFLKWLRSADDGIRIMKCLDAFEKDIDHGHEFEFGKDPEAGNIRTVMIDGKFGGTYESVAQFLLERYGRGHK